MSETVLVAGVSYPALKPQSHTTPLHELEHGLLPGEFLPACMRYVQWVGKENEDAVFVLFNFFTGNVARFVAKDVDSKLDFSKISDVKKFEQVHSFAHFRSVYGDDYRLVSRADARKDMSLKKIAPKMIGTFTSDRYVPYFEGVSLMGSATLEAFLSDHRQAFGESGRGLSMSDVYEYMLTGSLAEAEYLGKPTLIKELHLFSHSNRSGPIFVNTYDYSEDAARDEADRDGRIKDFGLQGTQGLAKIFDKEGYCVLWGCVGVPLISEAIRQAQGKPTKFQLVMNSDMGLEGKPAEQDETFHKWFGGKPNQKFSEFMSLEGLAKIIGSHITARDLYVYQLAVATDRPCYGLPPGASSDFDSNPKQKSVKLMHGSKDELHVLQFFKRFFPAKMDLGDRLADFAGDFDKEVGRGYIRYQKIGSR